MTNIKVNKKLSKRKWIPLIAGIIGVLLSPAVWYVGAKLSNIGCPLDVYGKCDVYYGLEWVVRWFIIAIVWGIVWASIAVIGLIILIRNRRAGKVDLSKSGANSDTIIHTKRRWILLIIAGIIGILAAPVILQIGKAVTTANCPYDARQCEYVYVPQHESIMWIVCEVVWVVVWTEVIIAGIIILAKIHNRTRQVAKKPTAPKRS